MTNPETPMNRNDLKLRRPGMFVCAVLTCVVAPPVRSAEAPNDGGGCNGGRHFAEEPATGSTTGTEETGSSSETSEPTTMATTSPGSCGDGAMDDGEGCDDGNKVDEDACPSGAKGQCQAEAKCGDGIVWAGQEECDGEEGCSEGCEWMAECGNNMVEAGEDCDDGNKDDSDACPSGEGACKAKAMCGDGFTQTGVEACDDGNVMDDDDCPSGEGKCVAVASCGDGFVEDGVEACDDGNTADEDECPSSAVGACKAPAKCGDGFVWGEGGETCDDMNKEDLDECSNKCQAPRWVFVTSDGADSGNLGGIMGADTYCQMLATAASLPGTYKAWLTDTDPQTAPLTRFESQGFKGWYRLNTKPALGVAEGWEDLTTPNDGMPAKYLQNAIFIDENGNDVENATVWTNTYPDGTRIPSNPDDMKAVCTNWTSASGTAGPKGTAKADVLGSAWTDDSTLGCNAGARLYCFQTG